MPISIRCLSSFISLLWMDLEFEWRINILRLSYNYYINISLKRHMQTRLKGVRQNVFTATQEDKENQGGFKLVRAQGGTNQSNPPLKLHLPKPHSPSFITHSHNKLEKTFTNIDENLHIMVLDHSHLKTTLQRQEVEAQGQEQRMAQLQQELESYQHREMQMKGEREDLFRKIKILLKENEKSTNFIELLARSDEEQKEELQHLQDSYQESLHYNEELQSQHLHEITQIEDQSRQNDYIMQSMEHQINQLTEENDHLIKYTQSMQSTSVLEEHIRYANLVNYVSDLLQKNEDMSNQLMHKQKELQCYQELEVRVDEVIQENDHYKATNMKLLAQLNSQSEDHDRDRLVVTLQQKLKKHEIKLNVMSEENIRLNHLIEEFSSN